MAWPTNTKVIVPTPVQIKWGPQVIQDKSSVSSSSSPPVTNQLFPRGN
jgi:hypothetical protein